MAFKMKGFPKIYNTPVKQVGLGAPGTGPGTGGGTMDPLPPAAPLGTTPMMQKEHHTSGIPETLYKANGEAVNTTEIDEGNFSKAKTDKAGNKYVVATVGTTTYTKGSKFYYNNPAAGQEGAGL